MSNWMRKQIGLYADGRDKVGSILEYTPPTIELLTEEFRSGGMDMGVAIDVGMASMEASFTVDEDPEILAMFGIKKGGQPKAFFIRSHLHNSTTGETKTVIEELRGPMTKLELGTQKAGSKTPTTVTIKPSYYQYKSGEKIIYELDPINMVRIIDGVDQLAQARASLGK